MRTTARAVQGRARVLAARRAAGDWKRREHARAKNAFRQHYILILLLLSRLLRVVP